jgi:hypothetical protein
MITVPDPVEVGFVVNLARPGGHVTGLTSTVGPELHGKRLELLRELTPRATRIARPHRGWRRRKRRPACWVFRCASSRYAHRTS